MERNVFYCIYHVEMNELWIGLNMCTKFGIHLDCGCNCEEVCQSTSLDSSVCVTSMATYSSLIALWELVVCPCQEFLEWHARECLLGV
jgi:hypothetical protein